MTSFAVRWLISAPIFSCINPSGSSYRPFAPRWWWWGGWGWWSARDGDVGLGPDTWLLAPPPSTPISTTTFLGIATHRYPGASTDMSVEPRADWIVARFRDKSPVDGTMGFFVRARGELRARFVCSGGG
jgi:hypothetical protein